jgi:hypothetical protein
MGEMIPGIRTELRSAVPCFAGLRLAMPLLALLMPLLPAPLAADPAGVPPTNVQRAGGCLDSGDGYLRAHIAGVIDAKIDWPNSGTRCEGETKTQPPGIRLSFQRAAGDTPHLLFVFGLTGVRQGQPAHATGVNVTVIEQGTPRIFGTLGDTRCTADSLTQTPTPAPRTYRVEVRGFCTQPAHAVRGDGDILVSTFEFAGKVTYDPADH